MQLELEAGQYRNAADKERRERVELERQKNVAVLHSLTQGPEKIVFVETHLFSINAFEGLFLENWRRFLATVPAESHIIAWNLPQ